MKNKTNIEEDIKNIKEYIDNWCDSLTDEDGYGSELDEDSKKFIQAIKNILADRERLLEDKEILEDNYKMLSEDVSRISKELGLQEDATIDEIYTAIRILKSKRLNMFEQLECNDKANKYDKLIEKIKNTLEKLQEEYELLLEHQNEQESNRTKYLRGKIHMCQELLDTEQEDK